MFTVHCTTQYNLLPYLILRMLSHSIAFSIFSSCFPFNIIIIIIITTAIWLWHSHTYAREYARTRERRENSFQCLLSAFECLGIQQQQQRPFVCTMQFCCECVCAYKLNTEAEHMRHHVLVLNINDSGCWVCVRTSVCSRGRASERVSVWVYQNFHRWFISRFLSFSERLRDVSRKIGFQAFERNWRQTSNTGGASKSVGKMKQILFINQNQLISGCLSSALALSSSSHWKCEQNTRFGIRTSKIHCFAVAAACCCRWPPGYECLNACHCNEIVCGHDVLIYNQFLCTSKWIYFCSTK